MYVIYVLSIGYTETKYIHKTKNQIQNFVVDISTFLYRSMVSPIKSLMTDSLFICVFCTSCKLLLFWFAELEEQFQVLNLYKTVNSQRIIQQILVFFDEIMKLSCILLDVQNKNYKIKNKK